MVYEWKVPIYKVPAQDAGEELERISKMHGKLTAEAVVDESRAEDAVLHGCFEWDDQRAAEQYRVSQASKLIRTISVKVEATDDGQPQQVRAFFPVDGSYEPIRKIVSVHDLYARILETAMSELIAFKQKYQTLTELDSLFKEIDRLFTAQGGS